LLKLIGSVCLLGFRIITKDDITVELSEETRVSEEGITDVMRQGYSFCWKWGAPTAFKRPIPAPGMNMSPRDCVLWVK
jgi:hypothetical protein